MPAIDMYCVNVWLKVQQPANTPVVRERLAELGRLSRQEPGCLAYDVFQSQTDENCFLLVERWETKEAWELHRAAAPVQQIYVPQVLPLVERQAHPSTLLE